MRFTPSFLMGILLLSACGSGGSSSGADSPEVEAGKKTVEDRLCASCHLSDFSGSTTAYPGTQAYPRNLTPDDETGLGSWSDDQIVTAILDGKSNKGRQLCNVMPQYGALDMTEQQALEVVAYLRSLTPVKKEIPKTVSCTASP